jgi:hypothetical protein
LDPNYPDLILVKRLTKAIDEISKNEELMEGILAAAAAEEDNDAEGGEGGERLNTIGEEQDDYTGNYNQKKSSTNMLRQS